LRSHPFLVGTFVVDTVVAVAIPFSCFGELIVAGEILEVMIVEVPGVQLKLDGISLLNAHILVKVCGTKVKQERRTKTTLGQKPKELFLFVLVCEF
jgi:hypothetical protein